MDEVERDDTELDPEAIADALPEDDLAEDGVESIEDLAAKEDEEEDSYEDEEEDEGVVVDEEESYD
jgi:hypothetical protein